MLKHAKNYGTAVVVEKLEGKEVVQMKMRVVGNGSIQFEFISPEDFFLTAQQMEKKEQKRKRKRKRKGKKLKCMLSGFI